MVSFYKCRYEFQVLEAIKVLLRLLLYFAAP